MSQVFLYFTSYSAKFFCLLLHFYGNCKNATSSSGSFEIGTLEIGSLEIGPLEIGPLEIGPRVGQHCFSASTIRNLVFLLCLYPTNNLPFSLLSFFLQFSVFSFL